MRNSVFAAAAVALLVMGCEGPESPSLETGLALEILMSTEVSAVADRGVVRIWTSSGTRVPPDRQLSRGEEITISLPAGSYIVDVEGWNTSANLLEAYDVANVTVSSGRTSNVTIQPTRFRPTITVRTPSVNAGGTFVADIEFLNNHVENRVSISATPTFSTILQTQVFPAGTQSASISLIVGPGVYFARAEAKTRSGSWGFGDAGQFTILPEVSGATVIEVSAAALGFTAALGADPDPVIQNITLVNGGSAVLDWNLEVVGDWLSVGAQTGTLGSGNERTLGVQVSSASLPVGTYLGELRFTGNAPPVTVAVSLSVSADTHSLNIRGAGTGSGVVTSSPPSISCQITAGNGNCTADFNSSAVVTLSAAPAAGMTFSGWTGACSGLSCSVSMSVDRLVRAAFDSIPVGTKRLTVNITTGKGDGSVVSAPPGITCSVNDGVQTGQCSSDFSINTSVTLTASPGQYTDFDGWTGSGCTGPGTCVVTMSDDRSVTAQMPRKALVGVSGTNSVAFTVAQGSNPPSQSKGISNSGEKTLNWSAAANVNWLSVGPSSGVLTPQQAQNLTLSVSSAGLSAGNYSGVVLIDDPAAGNTPRTINVTLAVTAAAVVTKRLSVNITSGSGFGRVTSSPAGIDCLITKGVLGTFCGFDFPITTAVTLTAAPESSTDFDGWSGSGCGGQGTCVVTMSVDRSVTASMPRKATVSVSGSNTLTFSVNQGSNPANQTKQIANIGDKPLNWTAGPNVSWMTVSPTSGVLNPAQAQVLTVSINSSGLSAGSHTGSVVINDPAAGNTPRTIDVTLTVNPSAFNLDLAPIPAGSFQMGSTTGSTDEQPVHTVTLSAFYIQKTEVTQGLWTAVMGSNPSNDTGCGTNCPVESVTWNDIQTFLGLINAADPGKNYRLPTEAEWEYAARAGTTGDYGGNGVLSDMGWYGDNSGAASHVVATKQANAWGLNDMHGNVWEWVQDWYSAAYYGVSPSSNPPGIDSASRKVLRGGAWDSGAPDARSPNRHREPTTTGTQYYGFRVARNP